jgi:flagellar biosynthesis component FlhA
MNELRFKFGKFFIILGGLSLLLFVFSMIADSANFYLIITGILLILFGTILRKKTKVKESEPDVSDLKKNHRGKYRNSRFKEQDKQEDRQSRKSRRS